jgi:hypothetical protein
LCRSWISRGAAPMDRAVFSNNACRCIGSITRKSARG